MLRWLSSITAFVTVMLRAALASASPTFPPAIAEHLDLSCEPDCTTCHTRPTGGLGTARQPFGNAMQGAGLSAGQPQKIAAALDELESERSDVDGDGVTDVDELRALTNPNTEADEPLKCLDEGSGDGGGCAVDHRATRPRVSHAAGTLSLAAGLFLLRRRHTATKRR